MRENDAVGREARPVERRGVLDLDVARHAIAGRSARKQPDPPPVVDGVPSAVARRPQREDAARSRTERREPLDGQARHVVERVEPDLGERAVAVGDTVTVEIMPEGPQRDDLADDLAAALDANPDAGAFFDSLAQFYRKAYLRWIDATKRRPEQRALRIAEVIGLLGAGVKQRPNT